MPKKTLTPKRLTNSQALAALRIAVGLLFLIFAQYKVFGTEFTLGGGFQHWINLFIREGGAYPFMVDVLKGFVLPHGTLIAFLVAYGELAIGVSLVTGILVRTASVFGAIFMIALLLSANYPGPNVPIWRYFGASLEHSVFLLCFVTFIVSDSASAASIPASRWWRASRGSIRQ
jgi:thiosulfate dehydrogenase (quinone) large subunit